MCWGLCGVVQSRCDATRPHSHPHPYQNEKKNSQAWRTRKLLLCTAFGALLPGADAQERIELLQSSVVLGALVSSIINQALIKQTGRHTLLLSFEHLVDPYVGKVGRLISEGGCTFPDLGNGHIELGRLFDSEKARSRARVWDDKRRCRRGRGEESNRGGDGLHRDCYMFQLDYLD